MTPGAPSPYSPLIAKSAPLPIILLQSLAHAGILLGLIAGGILWVLLVRSPLGHQITVDGVVYCCQSRGGKRDKTGLRQKSPQSLIYRTALRVCAKRIPEGRTPVPQTPAQTLL
jgi:hypothetical protein